MRALRKTAWLRKETQMKNKISYAALKEIQSECPEMCERMAIQYNIVAEKIEFKFKIEPGRPVEFYRVLYWYTRKTKNIWLDIP